MRLRDRLDGTARRLRPWSQELQWGAIGVLGAAALTLGFVGIRSYMIARGEPADWLTVLYNDLQLFVLEPGTREGDVPWQLDVARIAVPALTVLAAFKAITLLLRDDWILLRSRLARDHVIVCGLGRRGLRLTRSLIDRGERVVVVDCDADNDRLRAARHAGAGTLVGDATDPEVLRRAGVTRAARLISVCDEDGTNASVAATARELAKGRRGRSLACMVHIHDHALRELMRGKEVAAAEAIPFRLDVFNLFEDGARAMVLDHPVTAEGGPERPHVIVVGLGWLGTPLVVEVARSWRARGGLERHGPLPVTLVDPKGEERRRSLLVRHPWIEEVCDLHVAATEVGQAEFESAELLAEALGDVPAAGGILAYVCLDDTALALPGALTLRDRLGGQARIVVRTETEQGLASLLDARPGENTPGIVPFPLLDRVCQADSVIGFTFTERLARAMHEEYLDRETHDPSHPSMRPWEELDDSLRESNRDAARDVGRKLSVVGCRPYLVNGQPPSDFRFTDRELDELAPMEHERWVAERLRNGWKPGPRAEGARTSPYLVPFDDLPSEVQGYDRDAVSVLPRVLARTGYGIARSSS